MNTRFLGSKEFRHLGGNAAHSTACPLPPCSALQILAIPLGITAVCALIMPTNSKHLNAPNYGI